MMRKWLKCIIVHRGHDYEYVQKWKDKHPEILVKTCTRCGNEDNVIVCKGLGVERPTTGVTLLIHKDDSRFNELERVLDSLVSDGLIDHVDVRTGEVALHGISDLERVRTAISSFV